MTTYVMFGKYSAGSVEGMSAKRTDKAIECVKELGGEVKTMYSLLGQHDLLLITEFPSLENVIKASVLLNKLTGIVFTTAPAISVKEFDRLMS